MDAIVHWLLASALSHWIRSTRGVWPALQILHFVGLSLLIGAMLIVDLRLAGFWRRINIAVVRALLPWAVVGFAINVMTGLMFFVGDPHRYVANIGFRIKMLLIIIAGLNALWFGWRIAPVMGAWDPNGATSRSARVVAYLSLGSWCGVLVCGRLIPYVGTG